MKSMTGFGRGESKNSNYEIVVEAKTVNSKHRDFFVKIPRSLNVIDGKIRQRAQDFINRGKLDLFISFTPLNEEHQEVLINKGLARSYVKALNDLMKLDPMIEAEIDVNALAAIPDVLKIQQAQISEEELWELISPVLNEALEGLVAARQSEGDHLKDDLLEHTNNTNNLVAKLKETAPEAFQVSTQNLKNRINLLLEDAAIDENLILNEIAILSDKLAVDEEIARLDSHIDRLYKLLDSNEPVGRKIDFLLQEMNRETNTIGSKTDNIEMKNIVVDMKSEIEKIREQVQNIE